MNSLQKYLDDNNLTRYQIYKKTGLSQMTLSHAVSDKKDINGQSVKIIKAVADTLGKTPGEVLDELLKLEES